MFAAAHARKQTERLQLKSTVQVRHPSQPACGGKKKQKKTREPGIFITTRFNSVTSGVSYKLPSASPSADAATV